MKKVIFGLVFLLPVLALAQTPPTANLGFLAQIVTQIGNAVRLLIPILFALAIIYFFWGLIKYIQSAGDPVAAAKGKSIMIYGIIAIAVMASLYGIISWLQGVVGVNPTTTTTVPTVPGLQ